MNLDTTQTIHAFALRELALIMGLSDEEMDNHIKRVRDTMMENDDMRISEAIPKMVDGCNMSDVMTGVILAIFASDYYFGQYINGDINDNR